jgi:collagenase-like PrtC family protease
MELSIPTNWDNSILEKTKGFAIKEFFGKSAVDYFGGGRPSLYIPSLTNTSLAKHIALMHQYGHRFNYLLNASCMDNAEFTRPGQRRMHKFLDWLIKIKIDAVTVSIPYLVPWIKHNYPNLKVKASVIADINSLSKAKYWEDLGVDSMVLGLDCNRDFPLLRSIRSNVKCGIALIVNLACLKSCALSPYHYVLGSHASQSKHKIKHFFIDYCMFFCTWLRLKDPSQIIRSGWIRPEDLHLYEEIGIHSFKIVGRVLTTEKIAEITKAYTDRRYDGNILSLFAPFSGEAKFTFEKFIRGLKYMLRPSNVRMSFLKKVFDLSNKKLIAVDNRSLDGFLERIINTNCRLVNCDTCGYCRSISDKVIQIDHEYRERLKNAYRQILDDLESGKAFI